MKALVTASFSKDSLRKLEELVSKVITDGWGFTGKRLTPQELKDKLKESEAEILIVEYESVTAEVIESCQELKIIGCCSGSPHTNIDIAAASGANIPVIYSPGRNAVSVAELTWGLILSHIKHITKTHHSIMNKNWENVSWDIDGRTPKKSFSAPELLGRKLSLIGFGNVAREVAKRAVGFGVKIIAYDPYVDQQKIWEYRGEKVDLDTALREGDIISLHCRLNEETEGLLGEEEFKKMKSSSYLINTARAGIIKQNALYRALKRHWIRGAAIDVLYQEPIDPDNPLLELDNITITPHIGGASPDRVRRQSRMIVGDIKRFLTIKRPRHLYNPEVKID